MATHPVPYYVPLFRALARHGGLDVRVFFSSRVGLSNTVDPGMGVEIVWKTDLLGGYDKEFLPGAENILSTKPMEVDNPGLSTPLQRFDPDVVLIHGFMWKTAARTLLWCMRRRVPAMMISDGSLHSGTGALTARLKSIVLPWVFRRYRAFLCIGDANQRYFQTFGVPPDRLFRVPAMVDEGFWTFRERREATRKAMRAELGLLDEDLAVLFVGKLIPRKRPGDLLEALRCLAMRPATKRRVRVLYAGDGEQRAELEQKAVEFGLPADFLGFVNIDKLPAYYCAADVLAHPAEIEVYGMIVLEAAILGLPLVLSDRVGAVGPTSIARPGVNTLLHACGDAEGLADGLARLANEPDLLSRMASESLRISRDHDGRASVAGAMDAVRACLASRPALAEMAAEGGA